MERRLYKKRDSGRIVSDQQNHLPEAQNNIEKINGISKLLVGKKANKDMNSRYRN
jgi:hypothetical protein